MNIDDPWVFVRILMVKNFKAIHTMFVVLLVKYGVIEAFALALCAGVYTMHMVQ